MKRGYKRLLIFMSFVFIVLIINPFPFHFLSKYKMFVFLSILLLFFHLYFVCEKNKQRYLKDILFEVFICLTTFFLLYYLLGLVVGLVKAPNYFTLRGIRDFILPITLFCIVREVLRYNMLLKSDGNWLCTIITVLMFIILDLANNFNYLNFQTKYDVFRFFALFLLPTISSNISYSYVSKKIGYIPVIAFDLAFSLYPYLLPIRPNPNEYLVAMIYLLVPVVFAYRILKFFELKKDDQISRNYQKRKIEGIVIPVIIIVTIIYFYSGYFRFYAIAIASGSMTPNINKGDIVIVDQRYSSINENDVIAFKKEQLIVVHRVVKIIKYRDDYLYYTKGDANNNIDKFVLEKNMIVGKVKYRIPYIGYPTVWFNKDK